MKPEEEVKEAVAEEKKPMRVFGEEDLEPRAGKKNAKTPKKSSADTSAPGTAKRSTKRSGGRRMRPERRKSARPGILLPKRTRKRNPAGPARPSCAWERALKRAA